VIGTDRGLTNAVPKVSSYTAGPSFVTPLSAESRVLRVSVVKPPLKSALLSKSTLGQDHAVREGSRSRWLWMERAGVVLYSRTAWSYAPNQLLSQRCHVLDASQVHSNEKPSFRPELFGDGQTYQVVVFGL
jgi:hypothetical protein